LELRQELRRRLNDIPGVTIPADAVSRRPSIPLSVLAEGSARRTLTDAFTWALGVIRTHAGGQIPVEIDDTSDSFPVVAVAGQEPANAT